MDESGGSGQPRSGKDRSAKPHAGPTAQTTDPTTPDPHENGTGASATNPTSASAPRPDGGFDGAPADQPTPEAEHGTTAAPERAADDNPAQEPPTADDTSDADAAPAAGDLPVTGAGPGSRRPSEAPMAGNLGPSPRATDGTSDTSDADAAAAPGAGVGPEGSRRPSEAPMAGNLGPSPRATDGTSDADRPVGAAAAGGPPEADEPTGEGAGADHESGRPHGGHRQPSPPADPHKPQAPDAGHAPPAHHDDHRTLAHSGAPKSPPPQSPQPRGGLLMGRPFGVPVYVAPSWFLVAALITWVFGGQLDRVLPELGAARYLVSLFFAVAFYASVLVHELAHTVAALRFKLPVRRIQLQFFGGVSEIEKEAETPGREFVLAFVGPLLSLILAGLFYLAMQPVEPGTVPGVLLAGLMVSNLIVAAFNLLPGLPLDGGRMLRAVVWKITGKPMSGTIAAAWVGRALAVCVLIGLPLLTQSGALGSSAEDNVGMDTVMDALLAAILAAIIWTGAGNSLRMARLREHLPELRARTLTRRAVPVETDTPLSEALRRANAAGARALVVVDAEGTPLSLVREAAIVGVPEHRRPWVAVSGLAQDLTDGMRVSAELAGEDLLDTLRATPATEYLVVEQTGEIYGVLSAADVERAFVKAMARPS
ncbi:Zn-dependent protease/CBS domain-containing protein [Streptomyces canus]|uniref:Zn-dependent protease/CBS domain-containing protein n=2 Tax=Streptomyces canus TaxID=58343 RepID=A0AAW8FQG9_9ACTN|nr:site-2 protease family protein [Streptomyces canus]MDQ0911969.1 Zn-dependent protease/CBS domain-containing protein [Streptomyces canus]